MRYLLFLPAVAVASPALAAVPQMNRAEAAQLYAAAGFPIANDRPTNACGQPASPRMTFVDISGDGAPEALVTDSNAACYKGSGSFFAVLTKAGKQWRQVISGTGTITAQATRSGGWLDMAVAQGTCRRPFAYDGNRYMPSGPCDGAVPPAQTAAAPQPARPAAKPTPARTAPPPPPPPTPVAGQPFSAAEQAAIFKAAEATRMGKGWSLCPDDSFREPATLEAPGDLNGDGRPEALITQSGTFCYGMTGMGYQLLTKQANGQWATVPGAGGQGIPNILATKGVGGWPDIELGGPGFCFPVWRFNGRAYDLHRQQYEGKPCKR
ncbi:hypothetical protein [Sphingomonas flavalba]|uniref:hypothetical protein n=1 Tax=Sphingomonas flavalba TaxID=2559804 RepID=UPI00109E1AF3|nr:hypothetical protein [Sphingomonas flavalba]